MRQAGQQAGRQHWAVWGRFACFIGASVCRPADKGGERGLGQRETGGSEFGIHYIECIERGGLFR